MRALTEEAAQFTSELPHMHKNVGGWMLLPESLQGVETGTKVLAEAFALFPPCAAYARRCLLFVIRVSSTTSVGVLLGVCSSAESSRRRGRRRCAIFSSTFQHSASGPPSMHLHA